MSQELNHRPLLVSMVGLGGAGFADCHQAWCGPAPKRTLTSIGGPGPICAMLVFLLLFALRLASMGPGTLLPYRIWVQVKR